jgi:hypothetical protein
VEQEDYLKRVGNYLSSPMFIIHAVKEKKVKEDQIYMARCANCGKYNTLFAEVIRKYFTLFWIPIFPLRKKTIIRCSDCMWTGTLILASFIFMVSIAISQRNAEIKSFAEKPEVGDIYVVRNNPKYYFMKITRIEKNNIYVVSSKMVVKLKEIDDINVNDPSAFYDKPFIIHKNVLWRMYEQDRVYDIIRE